MSADPLLNQLQKYVIHLLNETASSAQLVNQLDPALGQVTVVRRPGSEKIAYLDISLTEPIALTRLVTVFGEYKKLPPTLPRQPSRVIFKLDAEGKSDSRTWISLIAKHLDGQVSRIILRRDSIESKK